MTPSPIRHEAGFPQNFNPDFDVLGVLGRGGMGYVYKAMQKKLNREVALKVLDATSDEESARRFYMEAQAMKELDHQNLVRVFDFGKQGQQFFIAMTYVPGHTLADLVRQRRRLEYDEVVLIGKQVARGLLYAHNKGIVHRDIKPSNILLTTDNRAYITDFGISHVQDSERLTNTGMTMGTPEYMSPEQCQGGSITKQTDIYSFGIILYEMVCGDPPFTGNKPLAIAYKHVHDAPPAPSATRGDIPTALEKVILKCLKKNQGDRYTDMEVVLDDLDKVFQTPETDPTRVGYVPRLTSQIKSMVGGRRSKPEKLLLVALLLLPVLIGLLILFLFLQKPEGGVQLLREVQLTAHWEERNLEGDRPDGYPPSLLLDNDLSTAWLLPIASSASNPILVIRFPSPTIVTGIGFAIGYQKALDDRYQDRFYVFNKPRELLVRTREGHAQKLPLQNVKGMQFPLFSPIETDELQIELKDLYRTDVGADFALSEIRLLGIAVEQ
jgi:serine/threonine protein kinase